MTQIDPALQERLKSMAEKAVRVWGADAQLDMMEEEAMEVALELHRRERGRQDWEKILEECVDNYIMTNEMAVVFGYDKFNEMLERKLAKFQKALDRYED